MERHKNKEGDQIEIAYMRHAGGSMKLLQNFQWKIKSSVSNLRKEDLFLFSKGIFTLEIVFNFFLFC